MCRPHDKESIDASRATTFTKTNLDISGCSVCLGKKEGLSHSQNLVACKNCRRSAHWECVGIPVNVGTKPSTRPSRLWDCIYCLHLCECCFETCTNVSRSQCDSCLKMICKDCQGIFWLWVSFSTFADVVNVHFLIVQLLNKLAIRSLSINARAAMA